MQINIYKIFMFEQANLYSYWIFTTKFDIILRLLYNFPLSHRRDSFPLWIYNISLNLLLLHRYTFWRVTWRCYVIYLQLKPYPRGNIVILRSITVAISIRHVWLLNLIDVSPIIRRNYCWEKHRSYYATNFIELIFFSTTYGTSRTLLVRGN